MANSEYDFYSMEARTLANQPDYPEFFAPRVRRKGSPIIGLKFYRKPVYYGYEGISATLSTEQGPSEFDYMGWYAWAIDNDFWDGYDYFRCKFEVNVPAESHISDKKYCPIFLSRQKIFSIIIGDTEYTPDNMEVNGYQTWGDGKIFLNQFGQMVFYPDGKPSLGTSEQIHLAGLANNNSLSNLYAYKDDYYILNMPDNYKMNWCDFEQYSTEATYAQRMNYNISEAANSFNAEPMGRYLVEHHEDLSCRLYWPMYRTYRQPTDNGELIYGGKLLPTERGMATNAVIGDYLWEVQNIGGEYDINFLGSFVQTHPASGDGLVKAEWLKPISVKIPYIYYFGLYLTEVEGFSYLTFGAPYGSDEGYWLLDGAPVKMELQTGQNNKFTLTPGTLYNEDNGFYSDLYIYRIAPYIFPSMVQPYTDKIQPSRLQTRKWTFDIPTWQ